MSKNVVIFCDGTGQVGGVHFDEPRTNIYKMYRSARSGPDSRVDPKQQVAFYDPGIGSTADGGKLGGRVARALYNLVAQATGFGITRNIVDCYAAVIRLWQPGDRIYLFGFSRGAYTARCVAAVISLCGIPRRQPDGSPLRLDPGSVRTIAKYAVKHIYDFTAPRPSGVAAGRQLRLEQTRARLAEEFRQSYEARPPEATGTYPYFVGVFDTVAALINPALLGALGAIYIATICLLAAVLTLFVSPFGTRLHTFSVTFVWFLVVSVFGFVAAYIATHFKCDYQHGWRQLLKTSHLTDPWPKLYDTSLDPRIEYAKHAISIDENRAAFKRVPWTPSHPRHREADANRVPWFEQVWFAGNHADIGGGYPEAESRLSDIALDWMLSCACEVPNGLRFDETVLRRWPDPCGVQHDQVAAGFGWLTAYLKVTWPATQRSLPLDHKPILHASVYDRFEAGLVQHYEGMRPYRPPQMQDDPDVTALYAQDAGSNIRATRTSLARTPAPPRGEP